MADPAPTRDQPHVPALAALLAADTAATGLVLQMTVTIVIATATYLTATLALISSNSGKVSSIVLFVLPIPVFLLQTYQLVLAGANRRRTESTRQIESELVKASGLEIAYASYRIGSRATEAATDPDVVRAAPGRRKLLRAVGAVLPYVGFYLLGTAYTFYIIFFPLRQSGAGCWWNFALLAGIIETIFVASLAWAILIAPLPEEATFPKAPLD